MIVFNDNLNYKIPKTEIKYPIVKRSSNQNGRVKSIKKKISKNNKEFLQALGLKV